MLEKIMNAGLGLFLLTASTTMCALTYKILVEGVSKCN